MSQTSSHVQTGETLPSTDPNKQKNIIPLPPKLAKEVNILVDEVIWGHRFYNDQTPWFVILEFLSIFRSRGNELKDCSTDTQHISFDYTIPKSIALRKLIFNSPIIQLIDKQDSSDDHKWDTVIEQWKAGRTASHSKRKINRDEESIKQLRDHFRSFSDVSFLTEFFRSTAIEPQRRRRWTSKFIFPYGPDCLYPDIRNDGSYDRRFFGRGGELLYLMLSRSKLNEEVASKLNATFFSTNNIWNTVARTLVNGTTDASDLVKSTIGYLPFRKRNDYDNIADTWLQLLSLDLPISAILDPIMRLNSLHMLIYMLRRANEEIGDDAKPKFLLEITAPRKTNIFELSSENLQANQTATLRAIQPHIEKKVANYGIKTLAKQTRKPVDSFKKSLRELFHLREELSGKGYETIMSDLIGIAEARHKQHVMKVHREWIGHIGLKVARSGIGTCYGPNDSLLKAFVLCIVGDQPMEFHRFLHELYKRFGVVISANEAEKAYGSLPTDEQVFSQNTQRLEQRLSTLGLLERLSDDYAYVKTPFGASNEVK